MTAAPILTHIVGPAVWASYLVDGDDSGLEPGEREKADAWLTREGVQIVGTEPGAEPYFSWAGAVHVPELGCSGFQALDYRAREVRLESDEAAGVVLTWRRGEVRGRAVHRLHAPAEVLQMIGGAPCHVGDMIGTVAFGQAGAFQDRRGWLGSVELTPYDSAKVAVRGTAGAAIRDTESMVRTHLQGLGFAVVRFTESAS